MQRIACILLLTCVLHFCAGAQPAIAGAHMQRRTVGYSDDYTRKLILAELGVCGGVSQLYPGATGNIHAGYDLTLKLDYAVRHFMVGGGVGFTFLKGGIEEPYYAAKSAVTEVS